MEITEIYIAFHDPIWILLLSGALFFPVRQLIWVLYVRKKQKAQKTVSEEEIKKEKRRATLTSILLCVVFSYLYVSQVFNS
jgi:accessory gene regulator protein AgrB|tara:strand:- start:678 stop:920 length:243 start_codon:yes stop_codon:yes gene_type:complete